MDCSSNLNRALPFHIDLNETPLPSPREIERGLFLEHPESSSRVKSVVTPPSQTNVRVCSSCEISSNWKKDEQKEEWKCFKCVLSGRRRSSDDGSSGAGGRGGGSEVVELLDMNSSPPLDMNVSPPSEPEGEGVFQFVDLNEDLPVAGREVEQNNGAKYEFYFFIYPFFYI